jgi:nitrogen fixation-related uncharacterized protein
MEIATDYLITWPILGFAVMAALVLTVFWWIMKDDFEDLKKDTKDLFREWYRYDKRDE